MKYKVGDKVKVREWRDMADAYGRRYLTSGEEIIVFPQERGSFKENMKFLCGKEHIITLAEDKWGVDHYEVDNLPFFMQEIMFEDIK